MTKGKHLTKRTTDNLEVARDFANSPFVKTVAGIVTLATILFAALNANDNATEALSKSDNAVKVARRAETKAKKAESKADRVILRISGLGEAVDSIGSGVERAVQRGICKGVKQVLRALGEDVVAPTCRPPRPRNSRS